MSEQPTLRDVLVQRLTIEFGAPLEIGRNYRWTVRVSPDHAPINIALNSWHTPNKFRLWLFDPSEIGVKGVRSYSLARQEAIDSVLASIRHRIARHPGMRAKIAERRLARSRRNRADKRGPSADQSASD